VSGRVLHLSDLHVGANQLGWAEMEDAVHLLAAELAPELVAVTGDLTHRNRPEQHERAAAFLRSLERPLLVLPGNHDIPALPPSRLATPFAAFSRCWSDLEPTYASENLVVAGLNSVRPIKYQRGALDADQLEHVATVFAAAPPEALRVVALHHHLTGAPWRTGKRTIPRRTRVLRELAAAGAELVIGGHTHQASVAAGREFARESGAAAVVLAVAPGLGHPRPSRHAEASGLNVYEPSERELRIVTYAWRRHGLEPVARRQFARRAAVRDG
jgi:3',5'-cyclic AMP phosphodiesterase CpdA